MVSSQTLKHCGQNLAFGEKNENSGGRLAIDPMLEWRDFYRGGCSLCGNWLKRAAG
ncbi:conserved protein of unknown function [Pseudomonas marincola]|uniref:Uncharacterized protein n=1 Tax=Pseudomonas marincola TaxID=437900 RepID=A0A653EA43_9PSED|nr:conserved protein of unknown function [Pseudomonas marincola]